MKPHKQTPMMSAEDFQKVKKHDKALAIAQSVMDVEKQRRVALGMPAMGAEESQDMYKIAFIDAIREVFGLPKGPD